MDIAEKVGEIISQQLDVDKARGVVERKTAEKEASAVELVRATMEVERTRAAANSA